MFSNLKLNKKSNIRVIQIFDCYNSKKKTSRKICQYPQLAGNKSCRSIRSHTRKVSVQYTCTGTLNVNKIDIQCSILDRNNYEASANSPWSLVVPLYVFHVRCLGSILQAGFAVFACYCHKNKKFTRLLGSLSFKADKKHYRDQIKLVIRAQASARYLYEVMIDVEPLLNNGSGWLSFNTAGFIKLKFQVPLRIFPLNLSKFIIFVCILIKCNVYFDKYLLDIVKYV